MENGVLSIGTWGFSNSDNILSKKDRKNMLKDCCGSNKERNSKSMTAWRKKREKQYTDKIQKQYKIDNKRWFGFF
jgi:hypothetical protein